MLIREIKLPKKCLILSFILILFACNFIFCYYSIVVCCFCRRIFFFSRIRMSKCVNKKKKKKQRNNQKKIFFLFIFTIFSFSSYFYQLFLFLIIVIRNIYHKSGFSFIHSTRFFCFSLNKVNNKINNSSFHYFRCVKKSIVVL